MKLKQKVTCDLFPGQKFEVIEAMGEGDCIQYAIKDLKDGVIYSYFSDKELKEIN